VEVYEAIRTVLAVREFQDKPVPETLEVKIIEAARLTASSKNGQPWHFIVVHDRDMLRQLGSIMASGRYNAQAAFAIVVAIDKDSRFGVSDASRAIQSMVLTAWAEGVGSNWTGWIGMPDVAALMNIPESKDVLAVVPFGYPTYVPIGNKKKRKTLSEVAHRDQFGHKYT